MRRWWFWVASLLLAVSCTSAATPTIPGDPRFGVVVTESAGLGESLRLLGTPWYFDQTITPNGIPAGAHKALKVRTNRIENAADLRAAASAQPGAYWIIGNEPNVPGQDDLTPDAYAEALRYYVRTVRQADPTARFVGPEVLNMDATCTGCAGFTSGRQWLDGFRAVYQERYGEAPPFDVWSVHTYDMDWTKLPMGDPALQTREIGAFRQYLDATPEGRGKPIWLTEFAVVWGYDGVQWKEGADGLRAQPVGELRRDALESYLREMLGWLTDNADRLRLERWFVFSSHGYRDPWASVVGGIALLESATTTPKLTSFGNIVRQASLGGK